MISVFLFLQTDLKCGGRSFKFRLQSGETTRKNIQWDKAKDSNPEARSRRN
jgi:hypothetical protein